MSCFMLLTNSNTAKLLCIYLLKYNQYRYHTPNSAKPGCEKPCKPLKNDLKLATVHYCAASFCPLPVLSSCPDTSRVQTGWTRRRCQCWFDLWQRKGGNMRQPLFPIKPSRQQPKPLSSSSELALEWMRHHQTKPQTIAQGQKFKDRRYLYSKAWAIKRQSVQKKAQIIKSWRYKYQIPVETIQFRESRPLMTVKAPGSHRQHLSIPSGQDHALFLRSAAQKAKKIKKDNKEHLKKSCQGLVAWSKSSAADFLSAILAKASVPCECENLPFVGVTAQGKNLSTTRGGSTTSTSLQETMPGRNFPIQIIPMLDRYHNKQSTLLSMRIPNNTFHIISTQESSVCETFIYSTKCSKF